jgi:hypothetical protein
MSTRQRIIAVLFFISLCLAIQGTSSVAFGQQEVCAVNVINDSLPKSHWTPLPALIRIQTLDFPITQLTQVLFPKVDDGIGFPSVIPLVKLVNQNSGIINQFAIIMPAILTGNFVAEIEIQSVFVEGCEDPGLLTLNIQSVTIPLSE